MGSNFSDIKKMIDDKTKDKEAFKEWMKSHVSNTECKEFYNEGHIEDAWDYQQEKIEALFKIINDKDRTADVLFSDNTELEAKVEKLKEALENINKTAMLPHQIKTHDLLIGQCNKVCTIVRDTLKEVFGE